MPGPVRDSDFHPGEDKVRVFTAEPGGVLRFSRDLYVCAACYGDVVLWHYAFARHWFKINLTTDLAGQIVETGGDEPGGRFAFNCDIATPMRRHGTTVLAVDLFADVLVRADAASYRVGDLDELGQARRDALILPAEARGAARGLAELAAIVERGDLLAFVSRAFPVARCSRPPTLPSAMFRSGGFRCWIWTAGPPGCAAPRRRACPCHRCRHRAIRGASPELRPAHRQRAATGRRSARPPQCRRSAS